MLNEFQKVFNGFASIKETAKNEWEVVNTATLPSNFKVKIFIKNIGSKWYFCDKKYTLKFMNNLYELKSTDVSSCIAGVLKLYGFSITAGEIFATVKSAKDIESMYYNFVACIGQLANMYVFFDKPE